MNKKFRYLFVSLFVALFAFTLSSCDLFEQEWTWTFKNLVVHYEYIVITPEDSEDDSSFTLYYGQSHDVTWKSASEDYRGSYKYQPFSGDNNATGIKPIQYDSIKLIQIVDK